jgi:hypothetical protein
MDRYTDDFARRVRAAYPKNQQQVNVMLGSRPSSRMRHFLHSGSTDAELDPKVIVKMIKEKKTAELAERAGAFVERRDLYYEYMRDYESSEQE